MCECEEGLCLFFLFLFLVLNRAINEEKKECLDLKIVSILQIKSNPMFAKAALKNGASSKCKDSLLNGIDARWRSS